MLISFVGCDILLEEITALPTETDMHTLHAETVAADTPPADSDRPAQNTDSESASDTLSEIATEMAGTEDITGISPKNYDCNFTILNGNCNVIPSEHIFSEEQDGPVLTAAYERALRIREHLGVQLTCNSIDDIIAYAQQVIANGQAGVDDYQLVITHPSVGLTELITSDLLYDIAALESVNLNQPYWATDMMDEIKVHGRYLLGYQDLCLMAADVVLFDKTLAADWDRAFLYEDVLNEVWTLEHFMELSAGMFQDMDGDAIPSEYDMYGICILDRENLNSFLPASDVKVVVSDENGNYSVDHLEYNDKLFALCDRIMALYTSMDVHAYKPGQESNQTYPNALFYLCNTAMLDRIKQKEIEFGILPYPKWDMDQDGYRSRSRNGFMCVPKSIMNPDMVGDVLELLGYYSSDVKDAYCAQLLKAYDSEDDARMLDIIWESQVTDMGYILRDRSSNLDQLVSIPAVTCEKGNHVASTIKANLSPARKYLEKTLNQ